LTQKKPLWSLNKHPWQKEPTTLKQQPALKRRSNLMIHNPLNQRWKPPPQQLRRVEL